MTWLALPFAVAAVCSTLGGGAIALKLRRELATLIALSGGIVVAVALFDVLPEAFDAVGDADRVAAVVGAAFLGFFLFERGLILHHRDEPEQARAHRRVGMLGAAALSAHSFVDGLGIGFAFQLDTATGVLVFVAVVSHDFADGFNTVTFVLRQSDDRRAALRWLAADAAAPFLGALVGASLSVSETTLGYLLAVYAGFFLFIGATDLLPHAHEHPSRARVALTVGGFAATYLIVLAARAA